MAITKELLSGFPALLPSVSRDVAAHEVDGEARLISEWLETKNSIRTRKYYKRTLEEFMAFIERRPLTTVTTRDVLDYRATLQQRLGKASSVNVTLAAVKSLLTYCHRAGYLKCNPGAIVKMLPTPETLAERILDVNDILTMIAMERDPRNHALLSMLYYSAGRVSEVCDLVWRDLKPREQGGQVTLYGKGGKTRTVKLPARLWKELQDIRGNASDKAPVFESRRGGHLDPSQVARIVKAAAARAGIDASVSPHWMRHGHASHALDNGCPIHVLKDTLGHSSLATTSRYVHVRPSESSSDYLK
jgi:site-specific recombinase XerD